MKRRDLIKKGTLAGAAILLPATGMFAAGDALAAHQSVLSALSAYSARVLPKQTGNEVHLLASIDNLKAFVDGGALHQALPDEHVRAEGNVLSFSHRGIRYKVENVLPQHFDTRAKALG